MYAIFKDMALRIMKAPAEPPDPPLGSGDNVQVYRASPRFLTYRMLGFWILFAFLWLADLCALLGGMLSGEKALVLIAILAMPILAFAQLCMYFEYRIDYDMRYYIVTDRSLLVREGAFIVKEKTISYANVQNIGVVQGPLQRFFGISNLKVDTAGGGSSEKSGHGVSSHHVQMAGIENAREVRDLMRGFLSVHGGGAGLGDIDDRWEEKPAVTAASADFLEALRGLRRSSAALRLSAERLGSRDGG